MNDTEVQFKVVQSMGTTGWDVLAVWSDGLQQPVDSFNSAADAQVWIDRQSALWLSWHPRKFMPRSHSPRV